MCFYREYINTHNFDKDYLCIKKLILGIKLNELRDLCHFSCRNVSDKEIFITQLTPSHFAITNLPASASLSCHSSQIYSSMTLVNNSKIIKTNHPPGSFLLHLDCYCTAIISPAIQLYPPVLCKSDDQPSVMPSVHVLLPSRWTNTSNHVISITDVHSQLTTTSYQNLSSLLLYDNVHSDLKLNYTPYTFPSSDDIGGHLLTYHGSYLLYLELFWNLFITIMVYILWAKHYNMHTRLYGLPFLSALLPRTNALTEEEILHKFYVLFITIGVIDFMFVGCCIFLLYFHLKRKWTRSGIGCEFHGLSNHEDDPPYFMRRDKASAPFTDAPTPSNMQPVQTSSHASQFQQQNKMYPPLKRPAEH